MDIGWFLSFTTSVSQKLWFGQNLLPYLYRATSLTVVQLKTY